jgi:hypothetical protein
MVSRGSRPESRTLCDSHDIRYHVSSLCSGTCTSHWILGRSQSSEPFAYMPFSLPSPGTAKTEISSRVSPIQDGSEIKHQHVRAAPERLLPGERVESSRVAACWSTCSRRCITKRLCGGAIISTNSIQRTSRTIQAFYHPKPIISLTFFMVSSALLSALCAPSLASAANSF